MSVHSVCFTLKEGYVPNFFMDAAMMIDSSIKKSHPLHQPVNTTSEIIGNFGPISNCKVSTCKCLEICIISDIIVITANSYIFH